MAPIAEEEAAMETGQTSRAMARAFVQFVRQLVVALVLTTAFASLMGGGGFIHVFHVGLYVFGGIALFLGALGVGGMSPSSGLIGSDGMVPGLKAGTWVPPGRDGGEPDGDPARHGRSPHRHRLRRLARCRRKGVAVMNTCRYRGALAVAIAACSVVPAASGIAAPAKGGAVPARLVGAWNRNITHANWVKYGLGQSGLADGVWTMVIKTNGGDDFYAPGSFRSGCIATKGCFPFFSIGLAFAGRRGTIAPMPGPCATRGSYVWKLSGRSLTLTAISDKACGPRQALFNAPWKQAKL
jgi:hypothetical protein